MITALIILTILTIAIAPIAILEASSPSETARETDLRRAGLSYRDALAMTRPNCDATPKAIAAVGLLAIACSVFTMHADTAPHGTVTVGAPTVISAPIASR